MPEQLNVFISYSHRDDAWRARLERCLASLSLAKLRVEELASGSVYEKARFTYQSWSDKDIAIGERWQSRIEQELNRARIAILLVSTDFLASEYVLQREVPVLFDRAERGELSIFPIMIRPCLWEETAWLQQLQICEPERALSELTEAQWENALREFMLRIDGQLDTEASSTAPAEEDIESPAESVRVDARDSNPTESTEETVNGATFYTWDGIKRLIENSPGAHGERVVSGLLLFRTKKQRTWFAATPSRAFCVLDGETTRRKQRLIQWSEPLHDVTTFQAHPRANKSTGLVHLGSHRNWLYSSRLHPNPSELERALTTVVDEAHRTG